MRENSEGARRVLLLGFDAAAPDLVEEGMAEGWLPHLGRLRERGTFGRLQSTSDWLVSSHWASFSMGVPPNEHGCYHYIQWRSDEMALRRPDPARLLREPFWRELARDGLRVVAIDVPYTSPPARGGTVELSGWATNEVIFEPYAEPRRLEELVRKVYGRSPRGAREGLAYERFAPLPLSDRLRQRDQLIEITDRAAELASRILNREPWDLGLAVFSAAHRAGHLMWSSASVEGEEGPEVEAVLRQSVRDVYAACDRAIGRLVEEVEREGVTVLVFGLIGMAANTSRTDLLPAMLARVLAGDPGAKAGHERIRAFKRLRQAVPLSWRHRLKGALPLGLQDRLTAFWRVGKEDWERTRALSLTADVNGYVRINLRGRESKGVVEPGAAYDRLCEEIADGLMSFRDANTGEPVVDRIARVDDLFPTGGRRDDLPDLIVRWAPTPSARTREIVSPSFGSIAWPAPGKNPNGRSGNHTSGGFVLATGKGFEPHGDLPADAHILDLPPTICRLLGREPLPHMRGRVLDELLGETSKTPEDR